MLPLLLDRIMDDRETIVVSVTGVLLCGEIVPQALCSRYGLQIGAYSAGFVRCLVLFWLPITWPLGKLLDLVIGRSQGTFYSKEEMKALVRLHNFPNASTNALSESEVAVITGALNLCTKTAADVMHPLAEVLAIDPRMPITSSLLAQVCAYTSPDILVFSHVKERILGTTPTSTFLMHALAAKQERSKPPSPSEEPWGSAYAHVQPAIIADRNSLELPTEDLALNQVVWVKRSTPLHEILREMRAADASVVVVCGFKALEAQAAVFQHDIVTCLTQADEQPAW
eukprot:TRINITY_DN10458_c0_g1_i1.p1 TRINITY_DN10458_c0_g1~~TRINITY_DN10458_c0_g1_i1.p1  ORF type:complete len:284 (+),score=32.32 TRINITY_DN10458_c0_g1_i1:269-1120(+)